MSTLRVWGAALCLLLAVLPAWSGAAEPGGEIGEILAKANATYSGLQDYTCQFSRKELFEGKLKEEKGITLKYKKPYRYYMKWSKDSIEVIYAQGHYDNMMVIHGGSIFSFMRVAVPPAWALKHGRHTLMEADMGYIMNVIEKNYQQVLRDKDGVISYEGPQEVNGQPSLHFKGVFPPDRGYYGHVVHAYMHSEHGLPIKLVVHGWKNELLEQYEYTDLKFNVGLTEADFDINNPSYLFKLGKPVDVH